MDLSCLYFFAASQLSGPSNTSKIERSALHERSEPRVTQRGRSDHSGRSVSPSRLCKVCGSTWLITACAWIELTPTPLSRPFPRCTPPAARGAPYARPTRPRARYVTVHLAAAAKLSRCASPSSQRPSVSRSQGSPLSRARCSCARIARGGRAPRVRRPPASVCSTSSRARRAWQRLSWWHPDSWP